MSGRGVAYTWFCAQLVAHVHIIILLLRGYLSELGEVLGSTEHGTPSGHADFKEADFEVDHSIWWVLFLIRNEWERRWPTRGLVLSWKHACI